MGKKPGASKSKGGANAGISESDRDAIPPKKVAAGGKRPANTAQEQPAEVSAPHPKKSRANEIDDIFSRKALKDKKAPSASKESAGPSGQQQQQQGDGVEPPKAAAAAVVVGSKDDLFGADAGKARKRTEEGFTIYSEAELGLNHKGGGDTDLCPFDCNCCF